MGKYVIVAIFLTCKNRSFFIDRVIIYDINKRPKWTHRTLRNRESSLQNQTGHIAVVLTIALSKVVARGERIMKNIGIVQQFIERYSSGQFSDEDVNEFFQNPRRWREGAVLGDAPVITVETAQSFWQGVYDKLGIKVTVPAVPKLTEKQLKSLVKFGFLLVYVPAIVEGEYPSGFVKPKWDQYLNVSLIGRKRLSGQWVAVETITKPNWDDPAGYPDDRLMAAVKRDKRFNTSHDDLTGGLLAKIVEKTGFPKKGTRLPSAEEWNLLANLFNWLRENRSMTLPDLGSTASWEWCSNAFVSEFHLITGYSEAGGLMCVHRDWHDNSHPHIAFRVLAVL